MNGEALSIVVQSMRTNVHDSVERSDWAQVWACYVQYASRGGSAAMDHEKCSFIFQFWFDSFTSLSHSPDS